MNKEFRRLALKKIAEDACPKIIGIQLKNVKQELTLDKIAKNIGPLSNFVEKALGVNAPSDFKSQFLKLKPGAERENLIYNEIVKRGPSVVGQMSKITVPGPNGTKITYEVMPDYITIDGIRVPMSGKTAQKVANHFGMVLPTSKMVQQIWEAADTKIRPTPLSAGGRIGGKYYKGEDVVKSKISDSDSAVAYSEMIENELIGKKPGLTAGHMKTIVMTDRPDQLGLFGWSGDENEFNPIQSGEHTGHDTSVHTEYGSGARLIGGNVTVTLPDGRQIKTKTKNILNHPIAYKALSNTKVKEYQV